MPARGRVIKKTATIGIVAGLGDLPRSVAIDAKAKGYRIAAIAIEGVADPSIADHADFCKTMHVGKIGEIIDTLKKQGVTEAVLAGKFPKTLLFQRKVIPDFRAAKLLLTIKDWGDDSIINAVSQEFEKDGIRFLPITEFCATLITPEGVLTKSAPTEKQWEDVRFGFRIAKEIGRLDIGQTVVVKDKAVMAVEAIEGTDEAIRRGGRLAEEGAVVVKVIRPNQDTRFDVPVIGLNTLKAMIEVNAKVLAVESGQSIFLQKEELLLRAQAEGISVVGYFDDTAD